MRSFFEIPSNPISNDHVWLNVKNCKRNCKYSMNTKANLLHHLKSTHKEILNQYIANKTKPQTSLLIIGKKSGTLQLRPFGKQDQITESIIQNFILEGGMSISCSNRKWFDKFCNIAIPQYRIPIGNKIISAKNEKYHSIYKYLINSL